MIFHVLKRAFFYTFSTGIFPSQERKVQAFTPQSSYMSLALLLKNSTAQVNINFHQ